MSARACKLQSQQPNTRDTSAGHHGHAFRSASCKLCVALVEGFCPIGNVLKARQVRLCASCAALSHQAWGVQAAKKKTPAEGDVRTDSAVVRQVLALLVVLGQVLGRAPQHLRGLQQQSRPRIADQVIHKNSVQFNELVKDTIHAVAKLKRLGPLVFFTGAL